jgi:acyl-CoA hydrolase
MELPRCTARASRTRLGLISIAHPKFQARLLREAIAAKIALRSRNSHGT